MLLHCGAVMWDRELPGVNGKAVGVCGGGLDPFAIDITDVLRPGANELGGSGRNPNTVDTPEAQVLGKQRLHPGGIFYTGATGIW